MLKKLIKYDLQNIFKVLIIFYILSIFFGILTRLFLSAKNSFLMNIIGQICSGVTISMFFNIIINNLMRLWVRFKNNFYGDESYLTHTLPVNKTTHYLSKTLTTIISLFVSTLVIIVTIFIAYYSKDFTLIIKQLLMPITAIYGTNVIVILLVLALMLFLEFLNVLECGFTGIILGHKMNNNKTAFSCLYGFLTFMGTQFIVLLVIFGIALFNKDIMNLIFTNEIINIESIKNLTFVPFVLYSLLIIILYIINLKLFNKGVNVD